MHDELVSSQLDTKMTIQVDDERFEGDGGPVVESLMFLDTVDVVSCG